MKPVLLGSYDLGETLLGVIRYAYSCERRAFSQLHSGYISVPQGTSDSTRCSLEKLETKSVWTCEAAAKVLRAESKFLSAAGEIGSDESKSNLRTPVLP